ncbi:MAG: phosphoribosylformylglycinamidine synthase subunit PurS [Actinomycetota bacterium]|nr:phosphoribosylformylglycinamidine synthase subunit PurS [Actinomycetota bacterium]
MAGAAFGAPRVFGGFRVFGGLRALRVFGGLRAFGAFGALWVVVALGPADARWSAPVELAGLLWGVLELAAAVGVADPLVVAGATGSVVPRVTSRPPATTPARAAPQSQAVTTRPETAPRSRLTPALPVDACRQVARVRPSSHGCTGARPGRPPRPGRVGWACRPSPTRRSARMARVVVDVMLKPEILDPQGQAVAHALPRLGFDGVTDVRQGKRFELELEGDVTEERLAQIRGAAETLLSNPVIEDYTVRVDQP